MAILKKHHKLEICRLRAHGKSYAVIEQHFKEKHDITLWRGQIQQYVHPEKASQKWLDAIEKERQAFEAGLRQEPLALARVLLQILKEACDKAMKKNAFVAVVACVKQAHEIVHGKKFQMEHTTKDGQPLQHEITHFPPEPKDLADWEKQVAEAEKKRKEQEAKSEKEKEDSPPLLTH